MAKVQFSFSHPEDADDQSGVKAHEDLDVEVTATSAFGPTGHRVQLGDKDDLSELVQAAGVKPFTSLAEMQAALDAKNKDGSSRMFTDKIYRQAVEARIAEAMGPGTGSDRHSAVFVGKATNAPLRILAQAQKQSRSDLMIDDGVNRTGILPFASEAAMAAAMSDKRYHQDPAYRAMVDARVAVS